MGFWEYFLIFTVVALTIILAILKALTEESPESKGDEGERLVKNVIGKTIPDEQYVINKLILNIGNQRTREIDHVLINKKGIFVIETKNFSGRIYGKENYEKWIQVLTKTKKYKFENPIKQNKGHIYHLSNILSEKLPIHSIVVFVQNNIKPGQIPGVYNLNELKEVIASKNDTISTEQIKKAYNELCKAYDFTISPEKHKKNVQNELQMMKTTCPRCGKKLVERNGKNGVFMGCSGYPKCRFTKNK